MTVTATSKSGAPVTLSIGTTQDVKGLDRRRRLHRSRGIESDRTGEPSRTTRYVSRPVAPPGSAVLSQGARISHPVRVAQPLASQNLR